MYRVGVFISHSWAYSDHYHSLAEWIFSQRWNLNGRPINFEDLSIPRDNPIHFARNEVELRGAIYTKITLSDVVVIPTGMYASHSNWIRKEIDGAIAFAKPILAVNPWAQERKSAVVAAAASETVGWNKQSVINGIWKLYRAN